jgi:hypothetical protein
MEQLKQIAGEIDAQITPLLDQQQQQRFQSIREEHRRTLIEKMASQAMQKVETGIKQELNSLPGIPSRGRNEESASIGGRR